MTISNAIPLLLDLLNTELSSERYWQGPEYWRRRKQETEHQVVSKEVLVEIKIPVGGVWGMRRRNVYTLHYTVTTRMILHWDGQLCDCQPFYCFISCNWGVGGEGGRDGDRQDRVGRMGQLTERTWRRFIWILAFLSPLHSESGATSRRKKHTATCGVTRCASTAQCPSVPCSYTLLLSKLHTISKVGRGGGWGWGGCWGGL